MNGSDTVHGACERGGKLAGGGGGAETYLFTIPMPEQCTEYPGNMSSAHSAACRQMLYR